MDLIARNLIAAGIVDIGLLMIQAKREAQAEMQNAFAARGVVVVPQGPNQMPRGAGWPYYVYAPQRNGMPANAVARRCPGGVLHGLHGDVTCIDPTGRGVPSSGMVVQGPAERGSFLGGPSPTPQFRQFIELR
jgi:hypothetical protein